VASSLAAHSTTSFVRDRITWLGYFGLAFYAFLQATLGPIMPFLRAELDLNYTIAALHLSAFAVGMIAAGMSADLLAARLGRKWVFWGGAAGAMAGMIALTFGESPVMTIAAALAGGWIGSYMLVMIQAILSDHHGANRAIPLTESNVMAMLFAACAPLVVSATQQVGLGWRWTYGVGLLMFITLALVFGHAPIPENAPHDAAKSTQERAAIGKNAKLPRLFWYSFVVIFLSVSMEWTIGFWGADFLERAVGLERGTAVGLMTVYFFAMLLGRFAGSRLTRSADVSRLLVMACVLVLIGFPLFWLSPIPALNLIGLFVTGLGIANLFPLTLSVASGAAAKVAPMLANRASARVAFGAGAAILITPQISGAVADQIGISGAFAITGVIAVVTMGIVILANREAGR